MILLKKSKNSQYYFLVKARNGKVLVTSETYTRKENARKGAKAFQRATVKLKDETV